MRFLKAVPQLIITPGLVLGAVALALSLLGSVPDRIGTSIHGPREYASIEEAEVDLGFRIAVPSYYPSYLSWPPAEIRGQREPHPWVQVLFVSRYSRASTMVISQTALDGEDQQISLPWVETVLEKTPVSIDGNEGFMVSARGADGQPLNGAYWKAGDFRFAVVTGRSTRELLTIARSM